MKKSGLWRESRGKVTAHIHIMSFGSSVLPETDGFTSERSCRACLYQTLGEPVGSAAGIGLSAEACGGWFPQTPAAAPSPWLLLVEEKGGKRQTQPFSFCHLMPAAAGSLKAKGRRPQPVQINTPPPPLWGREAAGWLVGLRC